MTRQAFRGRTDPISSPARGFIVDPHKVCCTLLFAIVGKDHQTNIEMYCVQSVRLSTTSDKVAEFGSSVLLSTQSI